MSAYPATPESDALSKFFANMLPVQREQAFGKDGHGVLTAPQALILNSVAKQTAAVDRIDLLLPGGRVALTERQLFQLSKIFAEHQLAPIVALIAARMQRPQQTARPQ